MDEALSEAQRLTGSSLFDMVSGMFDITAKSLNRAAARANDGKDCRSYDK